LLKKKKKYILIYTKAYVFNYPNGAYAKILWNDIFLMRGTQRYENYRRHNVQIVGNNGILKHIIEDSLSFFFSFFSSFVKRKKYLLALFFFLDMIYLDLFHYQTGVKSRV
jgi:hypothetical protein